MGVQSRITVYSWDPAAARDAAAAAFDRINALESSFTDYRPDSELSRLSDHAGKGPLPISPDLFSILSLSKQLSSDSAGAFDITVGRSVALWRQARRSSTLPPQSEINDALATIGSSTLILDTDARTAALTRPGTRLDLGGIGKGFAAQAALDLLCSRGLSAACVALAGDIVVGDPPPGQTGWRVAADSEQPGSSPLVLLLANAAISTSGDTEQFIDINGQRFSHVMDPRTGLGLTTRRSVTVVADRGEIADALSTAACILGEDASATLIAKHRAAAVFTTAAADNPARSTIDPTRRLRFPTEARE